MQVIPLTAQLARQFGMQDGASGVVVAAVDPSADAAQKGLSRGIIILSANGRELKSPADLETAIKEAKSAGREAILLRVRDRGSPAISIAVRLR